MRDIMKLIEELEITLEGEGQGLFGKKKIDLDKVAMLVAELKNNIPPAVREAQALIDQQEDLKRQTVEYCKQLDAEARREAEARVSSSEILKQAQSNAESIRAEARDYYDNIVSKAKQYIDGLLADMQDFLTDNVNCIRNNRLQLRNGEDVEKIIDRQGADQQ